MDGSIGLRGSGRRRVRRSRQHGDLAVEIEACPGWDMRELVRHLGIIHLWAASNVAYPKNDWLRIYDLTDLASHCTTWPKPGQTMTT